MNEAIETRELITVTAGEFRIRGTYHRSSDNRICTGRWNPVGVLFLSPGFLPRAAAGDSAVYWADSLAKCGYPSFRLDLPALGDSDGDVLRPILDFIHAGGYAPGLSAAMKDLVERFSLSGVVIFGHCAGAVTAIYTAAVSKDCKGLVLQDPYFFLPQERPKIRAELSNWVSWSRLGGLASNVYHFLRHIRLLVRRNRPPKNANLPLLRCFHQLASAGMPILVLKAPALKTRGLKPRVGEFDYIGYLQALCGRSSRVVVQYIEGTNHSFADPDGRAAVRHHTEQWLQSNAYRGTIPEPAESHDRGVCGREKSDAGAESDQPLSRAPGAPAR